MPPDMGHSDSPAHLEPPDSETPSHNAMEGEEEEEETVLPVHDRTIRDWIFLFLYYAFVLVLVCLIIYCSSKGDINRLTNGVDQYGNICGKQNSDISGVPKSGTNMKDKPYAQITTTDGVSMYYSCVEKCSENSTVVLHRCLSRRMAQLASDVGEVVTVQSKSDFFQNSVEDIELCWKEIIFLCLISLVLSFVLTVLLRFFASIIIWVSIAIAVIASIAGTCYLWYCWYNAKQSVDKIDDAASRNYGGTVQRWLIYAIIATVSTLLLLIMIIAMRSRIKLVAALFKEAGKVISAMPQLILQPIWTFIVLVFICMLWIYALIWIESSGVATAADDGSVNFVKDSAMKCTRWYHIFALLWITQFILACQDFVIGGAVSIWFFTRDKSKLGWPIFLSTWRLIRYHQGSLAAGSLIIAIIKMIRILVRIFERSVENNGGGNMVFRCCMCCINCCLSCVERFLKFLSRNAYIEIGIFGHSFCKAAKRAFQIITNNALNVAAINSVGDFTLLLMKMGVVLAVIFIGIEFIRIKPGVHYLWVPVALSALFAFIIAHCFFTVYEMTIDTLLVCFCEDCDMNDGVNKPYFMNSGLMQFVKNTRKEIAQLKNNKKVEPAPSASSPKPDSHTKH